MYGRTTIPGTSSQGEMTCKEQSGKGEKKTGGGVILLGRKMECREERQMWRLTYSKQKHIITSQGPTRAQLSEPERVRPLQEQKFCVSMNTTRDCSRVIKHWTELLVFMVSHCGIPCVSCFILKGLCFSIGPPGIYINVNI